MNDRMIKLMKNHARMCNDNWKCEKCPIFPIRDKENLGCRDFTMKYPEIVVIEVERWAIDHPEKTLLDDFKEKYPKAPLEEDGTPQRVCPHMLGYIEAEIRPCRFETHNCKHCWSRPLED